MSTISESVAALESTVKQQEEEIATLKVSIGTVTRERDDWKRDFNMYRTAWLREIGGVIRSKAHEIYGFVLRTREIYSQYRGRSNPAAPGGGK